MDKEPITINGLKNLKKNGLFMKKKNNILKEVDMQNLIYYMIEEQNLDYKLEVVSKVF